MKKSAKLILIAVLLLTIIIAVAACKGKVSITVNDGCQTVFVKGNDLDLSAGSLAVTQGSSVSEIALNAEGVTVSGYDKDTVGEQTLTIGYKGATTTLTVNVVERMVAVGHVADYVVGEAFSDAGTLKITKDDGQSVNVRLNDDKIELVGFDSSTAGEKTINVTYTDDSLVLNGSFKVSVWSSNNVHVTAPTKYTYDSHETEISTLGGYLTITANSGAVVKSIPIKEEWISGFDPDVVTDAESTKKQTITIQYPGQSVTFTIEIKLSNVTRIQRTAADLASLDWSGNTPCEVSAEQGQKAMNALALYNNLNDIDVDLISKEQILNVLRPAAIYGTQLWEASATQFPKLFSAQSPHFLSISCEQVESTRTQFAAFSQLAKTDPLFTYGDVLIAASDKLGEEVVYAEQTFEDCIDSVCSSSMVEAALAKIDLMLKMYDDLADVPADWKVEDLQTAEMSAKVEQAAAHAIELSELTDSFMERDLFNTVSLWRPDNKNDYFEILYRYYFAMYLSSDEDTQKAGIQGIDNLIDVCMPGILETYYLQYIATMLAQYDMLFEEQDGQIVEPASEIDTIGFIMSYRSLLKIKDLIYESDDEMMITLFEEYSLESIISQFQTMDLGIYYVFGSASGNPDFENVWEKYLNIVSQFYSSDDDDNLRQLIGDLFSDFIGLTPELQLQFLSSINSYGWTDFYVDDGTDRDTMFTMIMVAYFCDVLPESLIKNEDSVFNELFYAFQLYLYRDYETGVDGETFIGWFLQSMSDVVKLYGKLEAEEKTAFDTYMGFFYDKFVAIAGLYDENGAFAEQEISDEWAQKLAVLDDSYGSLAIMLQVISQDYTKYPVFISLYECTVELYNDIIANAPQNVVDKVLYDNKLVLFAGIENMEIEISYSREAFLYSFRGILMEMLLEYPINDEYYFPAWEEYNNTNLREFFILLMDFYNEALSSEGNVTDEMVKTVLSRFQSLTDDEKELFVAMDGYGQFVYYNCLGEFFTKRFETYASALELVEEIINVELESCFYYDYTAQDFVDAWNKVQAAYEDMSASNKAAFDEVLKDTYDYYNNIYDELVEALESEPSQSEAA